MRITFNHADERSWYLARSGLTGPFLGGDKEILSIASHGRPFFDFDVAVTLKADEVFLACE
jgi:hypothetical protein